MKKIFASVLFSIPVFTFSNSAYQKWYSSSALSYIGVEKEKSKELLNEAINKTEILAGKEGKLSRLFKLLIRASTPVEDLDIPKELLGVLYYERGMIFKSEGNFNKAIEEFIKAKSCSKQNEIIFKLSSIYESDCFVMMGNNNMGLKKAIEVCKSCSNIPIVFVAPTFISMMPSSPMFNTCKKESDMFAERAKDILLATKAKNDTKVFITNSGISFKPIETVLASSIMNEERLWVSRKSNNPFICKIITIRDQENWIENWKKAFEKMSEQKIEEALVYLNKSAKEIEEQISLSGEFQKDDLVLALLAILSDTWTLQKSISKKEEAINTQKKVILFSSIVSEGFRSNFPRHLILQDSAKEIAANKASDINIELKMLLQSSKELNTYAPHILQLGNNVLISSESFKVTNLIFELITRVFPKNICTLTISNKILVKGKKARVVKAVVNYLKDAFSERSIIKNYIQDSELLDLMPALWDS